jgi:hypothetical protein
LVWPTAQRTARAQRSGRYLEVSAVHPAKTLGDEGDGDTEHAS